MYHQTEAQEKAYLQEILGKLQKVHAELTCHGKTTGFLRHHSGES